MDLQNAVQAFPFCGQGVDPFCHLGILDEGRGMMGLEPCVNDQGLAASPMFVLDEAADAVDVMGRIGAGEGHPEKVSQVSCGEFGIVDEDDEWDTFKVTPLVEKCRESVHLVLDLLVTGERGSLDN